MPPVMEPPPVEEQSGELFRALQDAGADIETAYRADREVRSQAGQNVIAAIKADNAETRAEMNARFREIKAEITEVKAEVRALHSRADTQQRVVWPLLALLATTIFSMLYRFLTDN